MKVHGAAAWFPAINISGNAIIAHISHPLKTTSAAMSLATANSATGPPAR